MTVFRRSVRRLGGIHSRDLSSGEGALVDGRGPGIINVWVLECIGWNERTNSDVAETAFRSAGFVLVSTSEVVTRRKLVRSVGSAALSDALAMARKLKVEKRMLMSGSDWNARRRRIARHSFKKLAWCWSSRS
jgi:hypothetical protein